jgi:XRE family transcriptional regulator, aerobic/anaerobic benzoate catabolism transcriptional regulator
MRVTERQIAWLVRLGQQVRLLRVERGWTLRVLAERAEVSERFLSDVERGHGNISLSRFATLAAALGQTPSGLLAHAEADDPERRPVIALLGLRGAGKSTIGALAAAALGVRFIELDAAVAEAAGMSLSTIFEIHGENYFRRLERAALGRILQQREPTLVATGGSIVTAPETFALLKAQTTTVWLKAEPKDHWERVVAQGDGRPMRGRANAMHELREILTRREARYREAQYVLDTSKLGIDEAVAELLRVIAAAPPDGR